MVAGAPRANHSGAVVLLKTGGLDTNILVAEHTLQGEGLASSFGYDLSVMDLNADGWVNAQPTPLNRDAAVTWCSLNNSCLSAGMT